MARRNGKNNGRVEPRFDDGPTGAAQLRAPKKSRRKTKKKRSDKPSLFWRFFRWCMGKVPRLAYWAVVIGIWGFIGVLCIFGWYGAKLPNAANWELPKRPPNVRIVGNDKTLMLNRGVGGNALLLEDMSPWLPQAVVAIEDRRFYSHFGFDPIGFARAMVKNVMAGRAREGASTLTQQLAKNLFLKPDRTIARKVQELIIALWLETKYSKKEILELYLNRVYFGAGAWGVDAASRRYFGKPAKAVDMREAAMIAGLLKAPSRYSPARHPKRAAGRAQVVLNAMIRSGYITAEDVKKNADPVITTRYYRSGPEHYVADMVMKEVKRLIPKITTDITVQTTISPYLMTAAQGILQASLDKNARKRRVSQAALVSLAPDGAIRALIGGRNYSKSQFNRAVDARRQPGSAFKTFVWQAALERGYLPSSVLVDEPVRIGTWSPQNYDHRFRGDVTLSAAFAKSLNTIAVKLVREMGSKRVAATARRMGITTPLEKNASLALGTSEVSLLELTSAYAPFANGGSRALPYLITRITGPDGKVLYRRGKRPGVRVVQPGTLGNMNGMLHRVITSGTGKAAKLRNHFSGGKTGTSQNSRDAWFVGFTAQLVTGVWFGNDDNSPTNKLTGGSLPAQVWGKYMKAAHSGLKSKLLPGENFLLATLPDIVPTPKFRPYRPGDPVPTIAQRLLNRTSGVKQVAQKAKKTILDLLFNN